MERVLTMTLETTPRGATHWSTRSLAKQCGIDILKKTVETVYRRCVSRDQAGQGRCP